MRSVTLRLDDLRTTVLNLGYVGENEHTRFIFDCKRMFDQYPSASASLTVAPPAGESYPAVIERDGDLVTWVITDSDLIHDGCGEIQLSFTESETVAKTFIARTKVSRSLVPAGEIPEGIDDFLTRAGAVLTAIPETIEEALADAKASGEFDGPPGEPGQDGYSPTATVSKSGKTATITITDKNGTTTAQISDGESGGTSDYSDLENKPQIAGVTLSGNVSLHDLGAAAESAIPDPTSIIDDTAGDGDTNKVWSADKSSSLLTEINSKADKTVTDALQKNKAPVIIDHAEGNPIVLTDGAEGLPVEGMKIHFSPVQSGTGDPSPDNVRPISGWTGVTAWRTGKNFVLKTIQGNQIISTGKVDANPNYDVQVGKVKKGELYTITNGDSNIVIAFYTDEPIVGSTSHDGNRIVQTSHTFVAPINGYVAFRTNSGYGTPQLELGSTASPYTPYVGQSYPVTFPETVYGGTPDVVNGVLKVEYRRIVADGTNVKVTGGYGSAGSEWLPAIVLSTADKGVSGYAEGNLYASYLAYNQGSAVQTTENTICMASSGGIIALHIGTMQGTDGSHGYSSADELKTAVNAYLAEHNLEIVYKLATPIEIQLDSLSVQTLLGDNVIWSDANGTIELDYRADTKLFIAKNKQDIRATIAPIEDGTTASQAYSAGKLFYHDGNLCKAKTSIASGATFTLNTNYEVTTVADELFALN